MNRLVEESNQYIVGLVTVHGVIPLDTGRRYGRIAAKLRAEELEQTQAAEKQVLGGIQFVAMSVDAEEYEEHSRNRVKVG